MCKCISFSKFFIIVNCFVCLYYFKHIFGCKKNPKKSRGSLIRNITRNWWIVFILEIPEKERNRVYFFLFGGVLKFPILLLMPLVWPKVKAFMESSFCKFFSANEITEFCYYVGFFIIKKGWIVSNKEGNWDYLF